MPVDVEVPGAKRIPLEVFRTDTPRFQKLMESQRNRTEAWFHRASVEMEMGNVSIRRSPWLAANRQETRLAAPR